MGALLYALRDRFSLKLSKMSAPVLLLVTFAFLDLYWMPAAAALDVRFRIVNQTVAEFLGLLERFRYSRHLIFGWFDLLRVG